MSFKTGVITQKMQQFFLAEDLVKGKIREIFRSSMIHLIEVTYCLAKRNEDYGSYEKGYYEFSILEISRTEWTDLLIKSKDHCFA